MESNSVKTATVNKYGVFAADIMFLVEEEQFELRIRSGRRDTERKS